jgi:23S rRNA pseudouridine2605 synthase
VLTNDGELTQLLTHPSHGVLKTYLAEVEGVPSPGALAALRDGLELDDGMTATATARIVQRRGTSAAVEVAIHEGRNRQVRRMFDAIGHPVIRLVRTRIGPIADRGLAPGEWRVLQPKEVRALYEATTPRPAPSKANGNGGTRRPG